MTRFIGIRDDLDRQLIAMLQANARQSTMTLAKKLHLSRSTVHERIRRLERDGVIGGYSVQLGQDPFVDHTQAAALLSLTQRQQIQVVSPATFLAITQNSPRRYQRQRNSRYRALRKRQHDWSLRLARVTISTAPIAAVRFPISFLRLVYCIETTEIAAEILPVRWHIVAAIPMDLMVAIGLRAIVYVVVAMRPSHDCYACQSSNHGKNIIAR